MYPLVYIEIRWIRTMQFLLIKFTLDLFCPYHFGVKVSLWNEIMGILSYRGFFFFFASQNNLCHSYIKWFVVLYEILNSGSTIVSYSSYFQQYIYLLSGTYYLYLLLVFFFQLCFLTWKVNLQMQGTQPVSGSSEAKANHCSLRCLMICLEDGTHTMLIYQWTEDRHSINKLIASWCKPHIPPQTHPLSFWQNLK